MSSLLLWATEVQFHQRLLGVGTETFTQGEEAMVLISVIG